MEKLLYESDVLYPTLFRQENTADKYLVSHCEFIDFSREMVNIKIDEDLQKVKYRNIYQPVSGWQGDTVSKYYCQKEVYGLN